ncbi:hypothetical protein ACIO3O_28245 [Streptomyces sp. NPDC087440]|uniref:hypothetical protein n=1 Tax=Streptomyces sp. NPDC087440 TaxID=3365790 RepID=UPI003814C57D
MTRTRTGAGATGASVTFAVACGLLLSLTACGVQPTGVIGAGESATGLTKGLRIYFVSRAGRLEGVSRPDQRLTDLQGALKLLGSGPTAEERKEGLTSAMDYPPSYDVQGTGARVVLRNPGSPADSLSQLATGQLVCTLARAQSVLAKGVRPDDVQVTFEGDGPTAGPYRCAAYLAG